MDKHSVRLKAIDINVEAYGENKGKYQGNMSFYINTTTIVNMALNHEACMEILNNSFSMIKDVIQTTVTDTIEAIVKCENPFVDSNDAN